MFPSIVLTEAGHGLREDFAAISQKLLDRVYGDMPSADRERLIALLDQVERNLGEQEDKG